MVQIKKDQAEAEAKAEVLGKVVKAKERACQAAHQAHIKAVSERQAHSAAAEEEKTRLGGEIRRKLAVEREAKAAAAKAKAEQVAKAEEAREAERLAEDPKARQEAEAKREAERVAEAKREAERGSSLESKHSESSQVLSDVQAVDLARRQKRTHDFRLLVQGRWVPFKDHQAIDICKEIPMFFRRGT